MKVVEQGILIHKASYSETSLLVTILCKTQGLVTFLFQGGKKKHGNVLFTFALIEFTYYRRNDSTLGKISEVNLTSVGKSIPFDPVKSSIVFFMAELVQQVIHAGNAENQLYQLLKEEIEWLDASDELTNYPLWFLAIFCRECGLAPSIECVNPSVLDLAGGKLSTIRPNHVQYIDATWIHWFENMLQEDKIGFLSLTIPKQDRLLCFDAWMKYYAVHIQSMRPFKSIEIIREVLA